MQRTNNLTLIRNLISALILFGRIKTTKPRARAVRAVVDGLVNKMKKATLASRRQVLKVLSKKEIVTKLEKEILPKLGGRVGGYLKTTKLQERLGDNASQIRLEWVQDVKTDKTK